MTSADFRREVKQSLAGAYLFYGSEEYLKRHCLSLARKSTGTDGEGADFNLLRLSGEGKTLGEIAAALEDFFASPAFFSSQKLAEVHECMLLKPNDADLERLCGVLGSIRDDRENVLILYVNEQEFDPGTEKAPSKTFRALAKVLKPVSFEPESTAKLASWVERHFASDGISADPLLCSDLVSFSGHSMTALSQEVDKLSCYLLFYGRKELKREDISLVSSSVLEIDAFDFSNAILANDRTRAFAILGDMKGKKEDPLLILGSVSKIFSDLCLVKSLMNRGKQKDEIAKAIHLHEYPTSLRMRAAAGKSYEALSKAVSLCLDTDVKMKSTPHDKYLLLEMLVLELSFLK